MLIFIYLAWFASHFLYNNFEGRSARSDIVFWSLIESSCVVLMVFGVVIRNLASRKVFPVRHLSDKWLLAALALWTFITLLSFWIGWSRGNDATYLMGDLYRFLAIPAVLAAFYFGISIPERFQWLLRGFVIVYGAFLIIDTVLYRGLIAEGIRPSTQTAMDAGALAPLVIYLAVFEPSHGFRWTARAVLLGMFVALIAAQMFAPILGMLFCFGLFLLPSRKPSLLIGFALGLGILVVSVYYADSLLGTNLNYLNAKLRLAGLSNSPAEVVENLSGLRLGEIRYVIQTMHESPQDLPLGSGLGGMVAALTVNWKLPPWLAYKHYLHSGLNEIFYRTGVAGLGFFLALLGAIFRRGYQLHVEQQSAAPLVLVSVVNVMFLMSFACDLGTALPILAVCAASLGAQRGVAPGQGWTQRYRLGGCPWTSSCDVTETGVKPGPDTQAIKDRSGVGGKIQFRQRKPVAD